MKNNKQAAIGLCFDTAEVRAVEVSLAPSPRAVACGCASLPEGLIKEGLIADTAAFAKIVTELLQSRGFSDAPVVLGAKGENMLLRSATFPKVPEDKLRKAVMLQAQQFLPVPVRELVLDFVPCGDTEQEGRQLAEVLLVGAKRTYIDNLLEMAKKSGRELLDIDSAQLASVRSCSGLYGQDEPCLLAEVDHDSISIAFVKADRILLTRSVKMDKGQHFYGDNEALTLEEADDLTEALEDNLRTSLRYFGNLYPGELIDRALLFGPLPGLKEIVQAVGEELKISITVPGHCACSEGISPDNLYKYMTCVGLAARGGEEQK